MLQWIQIWTDPQLQSYVICLLLACGFEIEIIRMTKRNLEELYVISKIVCNSSAKGLTLFI